MSRKRKRVRVEPTVLKARQALVTKSAKEESRKRTFQAKPGGQKDYVRSIVESDITICSGMAGTGKTHVAIGMALQYLDRGDVDKIVVARPAIEAGETLGFLPGKLEDKLDPFMRPIYDELEYFRSYSDIVEMKNRRVLEICSIGHLRGRTIKNAFILLDEAQNATYEQLIMFLSRFGFGSKVIVAGDPTQTDLDYRDSGGFEFICKLFADDEDIGVINLGESDMVRHPLIVKISNKIKDNIDIWKTTGKLNVEAQSRDKTWCEG